MPRRLLPFALVALLLLAAACESEDGGEACTGTLCDDQCGPCTAVVKRVVDGDTVELEDGRKIRYLFVDTPETTGAVDECYGPEATQYNERLVLGKEVRLEYDVANSGCTDVFGRTLAYVWVGDTWVNQELARLGYARKYESATYACEALLDAAVEDARTNGRGGWGECGW